jgi:hypothetical protein
MNSRTWTAGGNVQPREHKTFSLFIGSSDHYSTAVFTPFVQRATGKSLSKCVVRSLELQAISAQGYWLIAIGSYMSFQYSTFAYSIKLPISSANTPSNYFRRHPVSRSLIFNHSKKSFAHK